MEDLEGQYRWTGSILPEFSHFFSDWKPEVDAPTSQSGAAGSSELPQPPSIFQRLVQSVSSRRLSPVGVWTALS
jgi:hypothetical protein